MVRHHQVMVRHRQAWIHSMQESTTALVGGEILPLPLIRIQPDTPRDQEEDTTHSRNTIHSRSSSQPTIQRQHRITLRLR